MATLPGIILGCQSGACPGGWALGQSITWAHPSVGSPLAGGALGI